MEGNQLNSPEVFVRTGQDKDNDFQAKTKLNPDFGDLENPETFKSHFEEQKKKSEAVEGLPVVLFRKDKQSHIPLFEGDIKSLIPLGDGSPTPSSGDVSHIGLNETGNLDQLSGRGGVQVATDLKNVPGAKESGSTGKLQKVTDPGSQLGNVMGGNNFAEAGTSVYSISSSGGSSKITLVSVGKTELFARGDSSRVVFERLLATDYANENYHILAVPDVKQWIAEQEKNGVAVEIQAPLIKNAIETLGKYSDKQLGDVKSKTPDSKDLDYGVTFDSLFFAQVEPFRIGVIPDDLSYRTVRKEYNIISRKPPTSLIRGTLVYAWPSEPNKLRPMPNAHFRIFTDYVKGNNLSVGNEVSANLLGMSSAGGSRGGVYTAKSTYGQDVDGTGFGDAVFKPDGGEAIGMSDLYVTMATGITDDNGNFEVEVINLNSKGNLGRGTLYPSYWGRDGQVDPGISAGQTHGGGSGFDNLGGADMGSKVNPIQGGGMKGVAQAQSSINPTSNVSFNEAEHAFEVTPVTNTQAQSKTTAMVYPDETGVRGGPNPSPAPTAQNEEDIPEPIKNVSLSRVFRIRVDGNAKDYYYPSKETIIVQPFQEEQLPKSVSCFVREFKAVVTAKTGDRVLKDKIRLTIFRDIDNKPDNLPYGEGDGKYKYEELINPDYSQSGTGEKYEQLWSNMKIEDQTNSPMNKLVFGWDARQTYFVTGSTVQTEGNLAYIAEGKKTLTGITNYNEEPGHWINPPIIEFKTEIQLKALPSRILVQLRDDVSKKPIPGSDGRFNARILYQIVKGEYGENTIRSTAHADKYGYVELKSDPGSIFANNLSETSWRDILIDGIADGYYSSQRQTVSLKLTGEQFIKTLLLSPSGSVSGQIVSKEHAQNFVAPTSGMAVNIHDRLKGIPAWLQVDKGKFFETDSTGNFDINVPVLDNSKLDIKPKDVGYFDSTYVFYKATIGTVDLGKIEIKRMRHRIKFDVNSEYNKVFTGIENAKIKMGDMIEYTKMDGSAYFEFENVSVNNYDFEVYGPNDENYIPQLVRISNKESKEIQSYQVVLKRGQMVRGVVRLDGAPAKRAKVYIDISSTNPGASSNVSESAGLVTTYTDANGSFALKGIPLNSGQTVRVYASLDAEYTVEGDNKDITLKNTDNFIELNLKRFPDYG